VLSIFFSVVINSKIKRGGYCICLSHRKL